MGGGGDKLVPLVLASLGLTEGERLDRALSLAFCDDSGRSISDDGGIFVDVGGGVMEEVESASLGDFFRLFRGCLGGRGGKRGPDEGGSGFRPRVARLGPSVTCQLHPAPLTAKVNAQTARIGRQAEGRANRVTVSIPYRKALGASCRWKHIPQAKRQARGDRIQ